MIFLWLTWALATEIAVLDRSDGDPIEAASLVSGDLRGRTDERGKTSLDLHTGDVVQVNAEGYESITLTVKRDARLRVFLVPDPLALEVVVEGLRDTPHLTRHVVDAEMAMETAGNHEDAVRLVQSLPGVAVQREYAPGAGDLVIRGSSPGDSRYYLDGVEIPYLYHFNQYASVFPASQLDQLELFPSAFGASYGDSVGAIVEARSPLKPPESVHGTASASFVMGGGSVQAPIGEDWWVSAAARRSYLDFAGENSTQYPRWPRFSDYNLRVEHGDEDKGTGVFAWGASDGWTRAAGELDALDPVAADDSPLLDFAQGFQVFGARHHWRGAKREGRTVVAAVHHRREGSLSAGGSELLKQWRLTSRTDTTWRFDTVSIDAGWEAIADETQLDVTSSPNGILVAEEAPWLGRGVDTQVRGWRGRGAVYSTMSHAIGAFRWMPGLRVAADSTGGGVLPEPRLAMRYTLSEQSVLKLGGGRYNQRADSQVLLVKPQLPTTGSWQLAGGLEQTVANRLEFGVEAWAKWLENPLLNPVDALPVAVPQGRGRGVELISRYRLRERFYVWAWLALSRSEVFANGAYRPADGDQPLSGGLVGSWDIAKWTLGLRYRYGAGMPWTPVVGSVYNASADRWLPIAGDDNSARFPAYQKIDLRIARRFEFRGWDAQLSLEAWVVPKASAQLFPVWNYDFTEQGWVRGPTVFPLLSGNARF